MTEVATLSSSHVACLLALSGAVHRPKLGDFKCDFDVIMLFRKDRACSEERKERLASCNQNAAGLTDALLLGYSGCFFHSSEPFIIARKVVTKQLDTKLRMWIDVLASGSTNDKRRPIGRALWLYPD